MAGLRSGVFSSPNSPQTTATVTTRWLRYLWLNRTGSHKRKRQKRRRWTCWFTCRPGVQLPSLPRWETEPADSIRFNLYSGWRYLTSMVSLILFVLQYMKILTIISALNSQWFRGKTLQLNSDKLRWELCDSLEEKWTESKLSHISH